MMVFIRRHVPKWVRTLVVDVTMVVTFIGLIVAMFWFQGWRYRSNLKERCDYLGGELVRVETLHKSYVTCSARRVTRVED